MTTIPAPTARPEDRRGRGRIAVVTPPTETEVADGNITPSEALLRPAGSAPITEPELLLRATAPPEEDPYTT